LLKKLYIILGIALLFSSCFSKEGGRVIASVNEKELVLSEIIDVMSNQIEDSAYFAERFMNDWIRRELMISYAEMNLSTDLLKFEKQIEDYRASLLIYEYQQEILNQNFDTVISLFEIKNYYERYKEQFRLRKNIFKGRFIVVDKSAPRLKELSKWYKSENASDFEDLEDYCLQFAKEYYFTDNSWQYFSNINNRLPNVITEKEYFLQHTKGVWFEDEICRYYIYIKDYQIKGSQSPLDFERQKIKDILLNKKKIDYLKQLEDELYQNALAKRKIKIY
jgi:hypothetical protein